VLSQYHVRESDRMHEKSASKTRRKVNPQRPGLLLPVSLMFSLCVVSDGSAATANADAYPHKSIRFIVPFAPGGGNDVVARLIGAKLSERWGQQVIVDNRPGAGGNIAAEIVARSNPDGYTVFLFNSATAIAPSIYSKLGYDPVKDFEPVVLIATSPFALVVHPSIAAQSVKELIALARSKPKSLTYASGGNGSSTHLAGEQFKQMAGIELVHVPYKGAGPAFVDLLAGQVSLYFSSIPPALPHIKSGRVRALGVSGLRRSPLLPNVATIAESGVPGYESGASYGIVAPARTAASIVRKVNEDAGTALADADVRLRLESQGFDVIGGSPQEFSRYMKSEIARWAKVIKTSGARVE
jgi:tripartite-type tricarboxylate transporter receptor subunit TctC